ncbi:methyltransferase [Methylobacterium dankookense]|uniref:Methyltransferase small domain-containing protein n=1 Tax=Methylobacterium dankookense TaxID=560405 RepID=A0A564G4G9_9HYPH|nr:methyltransferase [Methylobacterium dankookense]GJD55214.1 hypothetical protein IFDJLNFL_1098 [Methylobacterium dankookense]VUF15207.1 hypothetical protein MTDSW087_04942 [Methylobacterium dankookense]
MAKLTKVQAKAHTEAEKILTKDRLSDDEREFVIEHWQESARHINSIAGAFFTPWGLACDFAVEVGPGRIIDLCAGMGTLSLACLWHNIHGVTDLVCIEANPDYAAVGMKLVPEARWIVGDVFALPPGLGRFDLAISNPPFGAIKRAASAPRFTGKQFEMHVIDIASDLADRGVFILPQNSAPFRYSNCPNGGWPTTVRDGIGNGYLHCPSDPHDKLLAQTGIILEPNCGIDTGHYRDLWHGTSPVTEIVLTDFIEARARRAGPPTVAEAEIIARPTEPVAAQPDLFGAAA